MENLELLFTSNQDCSCLDGVCHLHKTNMQRTPQPRVSCPGRRDDPESEAEKDEIRHTGAQRGAVSSPATSGYGFPKVQTTCASFPPRECVWESCFVDRPRGRLEVVGQSSECRTTSAASLLIGGRTVVDPGVQFIRHADRTFQNESPFCLHSAAGNEGFNQYSKEESGMESDKYLREMHSVMLEQVYRQRNSPLTKGQKSAESSHASRNQPDDDESESELELFNLSHLNECGPRSDRSVRQQRSDSTPHRSPVALERPIFQLSPRPPSLEVDDMRMVAEGNMTPGPWRPPTEVATSIPPSNLHVVV